jgi:predicted regulator of Ras-like GTPase activity (Roadblock/LC7/MglB family)
MAYEDVINRIKGIRDVKDIAITTESGVFVAWTVSNDAEKHIAFAAAAALYKTAQRLFSTLNSGKTTYVLMRDTAGYVVMRPLMEKCSSSPQTGLLI